MMDADFRVREADLADAEAVSRIYEPYVRDTFISFEEVAPTPQEMALRMQAVLPRFPFLIAEDGQRILGYSYASEHAPRAAYRWSIDVAVYIERDSHRRGIGRALYSKLFDVAARQGFHTAFAGIALPNNNSVGLHEAMGFTHLGTYVEVGFKGGAWRDVGWWSLPLSRGRPQGEPIPYAKM